MTRLTKKAAAVSAEFGARKEESRFEEFNFLGKVMKATPSRSAAHEKMSPFRCRERECGETKDEYEKCRAGLVQ